MMNRKGFTLIELLAVLVILGIIAVIAIPTINSSMQRTKAKQNERRKDLILSAAESFVSDNMNYIYSNINNESSCYISVSTLKDKRYLTDELAKDMDETDFNGYVKFTRGDTNSFEYVSKKESGSLECDRLN